LACRRKLYALVYGSRVESSSHAFEDMHLSELRTAENNPVARLISTIETPRPWLNICDKSLAADLNEHSKRKCNNIDVLVIGNCWAFPL